MIHLVIGKQPFVLCLVYK